MTPEATAADETTGQGLAAGATIEDPNAPKGADQPGERPDKVAETLEQQKEDDPLAGQTSAERSADHRTLFGGFGGPDDLASRADAGARYRDKSVEILRAATEHDHGFIPGRNEAQLLVKHPDGTLQVVFADQVTNPNAPRGHRPSGL